MPWMERREGDANSLVSTCCIHHSELWFFITSRPVPVIERGMEDMYTLVLHNILLHIPQKDICIYLTERLLMIALLYRR